jgi:hypothetical protein
MVLAASAVILSAAHWHSTYVKIEILCDMDTVDFDEWPRDHIICSGFWTQGAWSAWCVVPCVMTMM